MQEKGFRKPQSQRTNRRRADGGADEAQGGQGQGTEHGATNDRAHRHTDHTDEPHNHPNPPTHPHDLATTESAAGSTAAAQEEEPNAPRGRLRRGRLQRTGKKTPGPVEYSLGPAILLLFNTTRIHRGSLLRCFVNTTRDHSPDPKAPGATLQRWSLCSCYRYSANPPPDPRSIVWGCGPTMVANLRAQRLMF